MKQVLVVPEAEVREIVVALQRLSYKVRSQVIVKTDLRLIVAERKES